LNIYQKEYGYRVHEQEFKGGRSLVDIVEECFGVDDDICFLIPKGGTGWSLEDYINFALWVDWSFVTVGSKKNLSMTEGQTKQDEHSRIFQLLPKRFSPLLFTRKTVSC